MANDSGREVAEERALEVEESEDGVGEGVLLVECEAVMLVEEVGDTDLGLGMDAEEEEEAKVEEEARYERRRLLRGLSLELLSPPPGTTSTLRIVTPEPPVPLRLIDILDPPPRDPLLGIPCGVALGMLQRESRFCSCWRETLEDIFRGEDVEEDEGIPWTNEFEMTGICPCGEQDLFPCAEERISSLANGLVAIMTGMTMFPILILWPPLISWEPRLGMDFPGFTALTPILCLLGVVAVATLRREAAEEEEGEGYLESEGVEMVEVTVRVIFTTCNLLRASSPKLLMSRVSRDRSTSHHLCGRPRPMTHPKT